MLIFCSFSAKTVKFQALAQKSSVNRNFANFKTKRKEMNVNSAIRHLKTNADFFVI